MTQTSSSLNYTPCHVRHVVWTLSDTPCDRCGQPAPRYSTATRTTVDLDLDQPVLLLVTVSVHHCTPCHHYFRAQPPFLRPDATYASRVVATAVASVYEDGMARTRVSRRLARDFWVRPSEAMIRRWCRDYARGLDFARDYQAWVVEEFSGVLCVDEVYQEHLALLLAVDPAAPDGDRLVGYQLVQGDVDAATVQGFLERLRVSGVDPAEVITDGSSLYPATLAAVWPTAAHQLCLFHQTRRVTKSVVQVIREIRAAMPTPPARGRGRRPADPAAGAVGEPDYAQGPAAVRQLHRRGLSIHGIVRQTGFARNTVRRWLRATPPAGETDRVLSTDPGVETSSAAGVAPAEERAVPAAEEHERRLLALPPPPWESWAQVRQVKDDLYTDRFLFARRPDHLSDDDQACLHALLTSPLGDDLRPVRAFMEDWYAIWRTEKGAPRTRADARARYQDWKENPTYAAYPPLQRVQAHVNVEQFDRLSAFLDHPGWEATNNGAERMGRAFRHTQAPHFTLRTPEATDGALTVQAVLRKDAFERGTDSTEARSTRGRSPRQSAPALAA
ncbi:MAG: hypothetical protein LC769_07040 [Chloroflexi bacterium]|nr:hypothetical protein [Chloroflexota bacterium]